MFERENVFVVNQQTNVIKTYAGCVHWLPFLWLWQDFRAQNWLDCVEKLAGVPESSEARSFDASVC